jgi:alpha-tubulin suppressor-like RCC1 family protein
MKTIITRFLVLLFLHSIYIYAAPAGYVIAWGSAPASESQSSPNVVAIEGQILTNATSLAAGNGYALAVRSDSTVVGWGWNNHGQATGVPTVDQTSGVVTLNGEAVSNVVSVSAERLPVMALKNDGSVIGWGETWRNTGLTNIVSICGRYHLGVKGDGSVIDILNNQPVEGLSNVVAIVAPQVSNGGMGVMAVLKKDGTIVGGRLHGVEPFGQLQGISNATAIAVGEQQGFALKNDGTVTAWYHPDEIPVGLSNVVAIAAGTYHGLALKRDGTVVAWGPNKILAIGVPEGLSNVVAIAAGNDYSLAITTNRAVADKFRH